MILNKLDKLSDDDLEKIEILEQSIIKCWQDVFELQNKKAPTGIGTKENKLVNYNNSICSNGQNYSSRGREIL